MGDPGSLLSATLGESTPLIFHGFSALYDNIVVNTYLSSFHTSGWIIQLERKYRRLEHRTRKKSQPKPLVADNLIFHHKCADIVYIRSILVVLGDVTLLLWCLNMYLYIDVPTVNFSLP